MYTVKEQILHVHAADAVCHQTSNVNFCTKKQIQIAHLITEDSKKPKLGCPQDDKRAEAFLEVTRYKILKKMMSKSQSMTSLTSRNRN